MGEDIMDTYYRQLLYIFLCVACHTAMSPSKIKSIDATNMFIGKVVRYYILFKLLFKYLV